MKWCCVGVVTGSKYLGEVEADTEEQAKEMALDLATASVALCHQCSKQCEDPVIESVNVEPGWQGDPEDEP